MPDLTDFQLEVTRLFFSLPASKGFLLAGGAALLAQHLTTRPTEDLDFFTAPDRGYVPAACDALEAAARERAGLPSVSTTAARSAGSSSGAT
jgi:Nucleotidyl transferase AbiEii toxin, Type IV TA system